MSKDRSKEGMTKVNKCTLIKDIECPIYCRVSLPMYSTDSQVCVSIENCPFQLNKTLWISDLPK